MPPKEKEPFWADLDKVSWVPFRTLALIIWTVHSKYYERHQASLKKRGKTEKGPATKKLLHDISYFYEVIEKQYSALAQNPEKNTICDPKSISHVLEFIKHYSGSYINHKSFDTLRRTFEVELMHHDPDIDVHIEFPRQHLELLCIYGSNMTYECLLEVSNACILWDNRIRYLHLSLDKLFKPSVQIFLSSLQNLDKTCTSQVVKEWVCDMLKKETNHINDALSEGFYPVSSASYLEELTNLMKRCSKGFGVNISEWNENWEKTEGKNILKINHDQHEGQTGVDAFDYIRIFLVDGDENNILNDQEVRIIKEQLKSRVKVYVVGREAWKEFADEINSFDFAVLRVGDSPLLLRSKFDNGKTSGIFYTDMHRPKKEYDNSLHKVLVHQKGEHIYTPANSPSGDLILEPIGASGVTDLTGKLFAIYTHKELKS